MSSGLQVELDTVSVIKKRIQPKAVLTLEVYSETLKKSSVYAAFIVQDWKDAMPQEELELVEPAAESHEESSSESAEESGKS
jgi:hypothetical protein